MHTAPVDAVDHTPDDGAPRYRSPGADRARFATVTAATLVLAAGIVLAVAELLPLLAGWVLPVLLTVLTLLFLVLGRIGAARGSTAGARAWAGWAGVTVTFALGGFVNLAGFGGALVGLLLVAIAANAAIALWFRSPVHATAVQVLGIAWGALAHVFGIVPWAVLVLGLAGLWWLGAVGVSRVVVAATTVTVPVAVALLVHPLAHGGAAVDGADVAVLTEAVAVATTCLAVVGRTRSVTTVWSTARATAVSVLVVQVVAGALPVVGRALLPTAPWPSVLLAVAAVLLSAAVVVLRRTRAGVVTVLVLCALQLGELAAAVAVGPVAATTVGLGGTFVLAVVALVRGRRAGTTRGRPLLWLAVLVLPVAWAALVALPALAVAGVLVVSGSTVAVVLTLVNGRSSGVRR